MASKEQGAGGADCAKRCFAAAAEFELLTNGSVPDHRVLRS